MTNIETIDPAGAPAPRRAKRDVHGWVAIDKAVGVTSTQVVSTVKRLYAAKRAGHAGTLDPLASGALPIALGEATKTVPFVMECRKSYRFTVRWGEERDTDDAEGVIVATSAERPDAGAIRVAIGSFIGTIAQVPPAFSAIKVDGERAYDLARDGAPPALPARPVTIHQLTLTETPDPDHAVFEGLLRQGRLCAGAGPGSRAAAGGLRPCLRVAPDRRRPV